MRKIMRLLLLTVALATVLVSTGTALAGHPHYLVTPGTCVEDIGQGQTSQTSGGGAHHFHDNVHTGVPGTFAMEQENNPVAVYKEGAGPGCP